MALFSIPELREEARNRPTVAIAHSNLGPGDATNILDGWAIELKNYSVALGYNVIDIGGADLTYERMTEILAQTKPQLLINFSHGCQNHTIGNDGLCSLTNGFPDTQACGICGKPSNLRTLKNTAVIAYSCHAAYQLGRCIIKYGSPCFVGFSDSLIIVSDQYKTQDIFKEALMPMARQVLLGVPIGTAVDVARAELLRLVKSFKPVELISVPLYYNRKYLVLHGDANWKLF